MRPLNFTLHAILAAALVALAATSAAAQSAPTLRIVTESPGLPAGKGEQIEIQSFHWGPRQSTSVIELEPARITSYQLGASGDASRGSGANEIRMNDTAGGEKLQPGGGGGGAAQKDMVLKGSTIGQNSRVGANESVTIGSGRTETASGQATGKRQHKPMSAKAYYDAPLPQGSVRVKVKMPWLACRVGDAYPRLELADRGKRYVLENVQVASCGRASGDADDRPTEEIAFYYGKVR